MEQDDFFSRIGEQLQQERPFVVYRKPVDEGGAENEVKAFLQQDSSLYVVENFTESGFVFAPFDTERKGILFPEQCSEKLHLVGGKKPVGEKKSKNGFKRKTGNSAVPTQKDCNVDEREKHMVLVQKGITALKNGEMDKVVLSRIEQVSLRKENPLELFQDLMESYPTAFVYCWYHPQIGLWMGATPETLVELKGSSFRTMALAGTKRYNGSLNTEWGAKELQEQQYVTDSIVENLRELGLEPELSSPEETMTMESTNAYTTKAGSLLHLRTDIEGHVPSTNGLKRIVEALHPTPAVCGLPKEKAREFILKEEPHEREFYTGYLGELNLQKVKQRSRNRRNVENLAYTAMRKESTLYVNLRCMKLQDGKAMLFIGGGITRESSAEDEWQETVNKAETMKKVLK